MREKVAVAGRRLTPEQEAVLYGVFLAISRLELSLEAAREVGLDKVADIVDAESLMAEFQAKVRETRGP